MVSITGVTGKYLLQPGLITMHQESVNWLSTIELWKRELSFFQELLDGYEGKFTTVEPKRQVDHYHQLINHYKFEMIEGLQEKIQVHEGKLARMLHEVNEADVDYIKEHQSVIDEVSTFNKVYGEFKHEYFQFIEHGLRVNKR